MATISQVHPSPSRVDVYIVLDGADELRLVRAALGDADTGTVDKPALQRVFGPAENIVTDRIGARAALAISYSRGDNPYGTPDPGEISRRTLEMVVRKLLAA